MSAPTSFRYGNLVFIKKGVPPFSPFLINTGEYWMDGTQPTSRTTLSRGTHKIYKNSRKKEPQASKNNDPDIGPLANQLEGLNTGTKIKFLNRGTHFEAVNRPNEAPPAAAPPAPAPASNPINALMGKFGKLGMGGKRRKTHRRRTTRRRRTHRK